MTILERMKALFNKKPLVIQPYIRFEKKEVSLENLEKELEDDFDVSTKPVPEIKSKYTTKYTDPITLQMPTIADDSDLYTRFMSEVPGKRVFYGGKETKAYLKWKEDNDL